MRTRFPLSLRIFSWFLLNLALLGVLFWVIFRGQLGLGLDSLLTGSAGDRLQARSEVMAGELSRARRTDWPEIIARNEAAYGVKLAVFRMDGVQTGGEAMEPPPEVRARVAEFRPGGRQPGGGPPDGRGPGPGDGFGFGGRPFGGRESGNRDTGGPRFEGPPPPREPGFDGPGQEGPRRDGDVPGGPRPEGAGGMRAGREQPPPGTPAAPKSRFLVKAGDPSLYWAGVRVLIHPADGGRFMPSTVLTVSSSLTAGGWLIDPGPWLIAGFGGLLLSFLLWWPLVRGITRSLRAMTEAADRIAEGKFDAAVDVRRSDELGHLAGAINQLSGRLGGFVHGQKRFLGDIAHELCSPIARMQMGIGIMEERIDPPLRGRLADVKEEVEEMSVLVNELLSFSRAGLQSRRASPQVVEPLAIATRAAEREGNGDIAVEVPAALRVLADPDLLARALANLVRNAVRYAGSSGPVTIRGLREGKHVRLAVEDHGPGVPGESLERIFEPFYRPDEARTREAGGAGLGLAIVRTCVEGCQGTVAARNLPGGGLSVEILLEAAPP